MKETRLYCRPHHVLVEWFVSCHGIQPGGWVHVAGRDKWGEIHQTEEIRYIDRQNRLALDADGWVWLLPPRKNENLPIPGDWTQELNRIFESPRYLETCFEFEDYDDSPELQMLLAKRTPAGASNYKNSI